jgi:hypothetical protein
MVADSWVLKQKWGSIRVHPDMTAPMIERCVRDFLICKQSMRLSKSASTNVAWTGFSRLKTMISGIVALKDDAAVDKKARRLNGGYSGSFTSSSMSLKKSSSFGCFFGLGAALKC